MRQPTTKATKDAKKRLKFKVGDKIFFKISKEFGLGIIAEIKDYKSDGYYKVSIFTPYPFFSTRYLSIRPPSGLFSILIDIDDKTHKALNSGILYRLEDENDNKNISMILNRFLSNTANALVRNTGRDKNEVNIKKSKIKFNDNYSRERFRYFVESFVFDIFPDEKTLKAYIKEEQSND